MGDLNSEWEDEEGIVHEQIDVLDLHAWQPEATDLATYPDYDKRLDWILLSSELEFAEYRNLPSAVSDHLAVYARVRLNPAP